MAGDSGTGRVSASVLVVDDDPSICDLLTDLLESEGYQVRAAADGQTALDLAVRDPPDLLVADLWMPGLDGLALAAGLERHGLGTLPVLFISGMPRPPDVAPYRFIAKPFDLALLLRAVQDALAGAAPTAAALLPNQAAAQAVTRPIVLVVEDDPETRGVVRELLVQADYRVRIAATGAQAIVRLAAEEVDLVLLDLMLPDMDGLELCLRVRARESNTYLPIVMLSALGSDQQRHAGFTAGADDYVVKPFRAQDLLDRVGVWVRTRQRLKVAREQLERLVEHRAHDEAILAMARTAGDELRQPLTVLLGMLELWRAGRFGPEDAARVDVELHDALMALLARVEALERADHYATKALGDVTVLDLERARGPGPLPPN
ncbi:MAG TPA: response regulator [Chloroflexota bacterium]|jgi:DNA-binding response OmpR family regulator